MVCDYKIIAGSWTAFSEAIDPALKFNSALPFLTLAPSPWAPKVTGVSPLVTRTVPYGHSNGSPKVTGDGRGVGIPKFVASLACKLINDRLPCCSA